MKLGTNRYQNNGTVDESNPYWISFSDIMTGLLVIFILACMKLILDLTETRNKVDVEIEALSKANRVRSEVLVEMKDELIKSGIYVEVVDNDSVLRVPASQLHFESDQYEIPEGKNVAVTMIGQILYRTITKDQRAQYIDTIFIEGHTDSRPRNYAMGNWGLSSYRAIEVWNHWREDPDIGEAISSLTNNSQKPMFSVSGYAATRPYILKDDTEEKQQQNRRIDIRFTMKQPNLTDLENLKGTIGL